MSKEQYKQFKKVKPKATTFAKLLSSEQSDHAPKKAKKEKKKK